MKDNLFSVIIPLYNKELSVSKCINSVLNQTYENYEIIVVDDGSTDQSAQIVKNINNSKIRYVYKDNAGVSSARNKGISLALAPFVLLLDADDFWEDSYISTMNSLINDFDNEVIYALGYKIYFESNYEAVSFGFNLNFRGKINNYFKKALHNTIISSSSVCIRKEVFDSGIRFNENIHLGEDLDVWFKILLNYNSLVFYNIPLAIYNRNNENSPNSIYKKFEDTFFSIAMDTNREYLDSNREYKYFINLYVLKGLFSYFRNDKFKREINIIVSKIRPIGIKQRLLKYYYLLF